MRSARRRHNDAKVLAKKLRRGMSYRVARNRLIIEGEYIFPGQKYWPTPKEKGKILAGARSQWRFHTCNCEYCKSLSRKYNMGPYFRDWDESWDWRHRDPRLSYCGGNPLFCVLYD